MHTIKFNIENWQSLAVHKPDLPLLVWLESKNMVFSLQHLLATSILALYFTELRKGFLFNVANAHIHFLFSGGVED